ncbi:Argonaute siRNA chaperone complex subunit Arb1-domain-containing protein [Xylariomycetidae sp. FL2044]|nr:Argonaute siRNA chaperone complex subunit Arb1-domain-containing protein [Xylariomycetidae sp. FL2044]
MSESPTAQPEKGGDQVELAGDTTPSSLNVDGKTTLGPPENSTGDEGSADDVAPFDADDGVEQADTEYKNKDKEDGGDGVKNPADGTQNVDISIDQSQEKKKGKSKKKNKKKGAAQRRKVTGFEEFYADAPMTPEEAAQEKEVLYSKDRPFADRIEECIQRYRARRRMDSERTNMFDKYLFLGGVDTSTRQFTGMANDQEAMEEATADQIRTMTATDYVGGSGSRFYDPGAPEDWTVDFEGVVKGYMSRMIVDLYMYDPKAIQKAADLVTNFLNYVLIHDVCPEYNTNILAARHVCEIAPDELRNLHELYREMPGQFNNAARRLFCKGKSSENESVEDDWIIFRLTILIWSLDKDLKDRITKIDQPSSVHITQTKKETYEVVELLRPRRKQKLMVEAELEKANQAGKAKATATLKLRKTIIDHGWANVPWSSEFDNSSLEIEEYLLEDELAAKMQIGTKLEVVVCELDVGVRFIKDVRDLRTSFDTFPPQYLMMNWKEPVVNERPAPSVNDPDAEEAAMNAMAGMDDV